MTNLITIKSQSPLETKEIENIIKNHLKARGASGAAVEVEVVGIKKMHQLNLEFMKKDYPTDVLSFPLEVIPGEESQKNQLIGTIVLCNAIIKLNAKKDCKNERNEFVFVLKHGLDHLLGIHHK